MKHEIDKLLKNTFKSQAERPSDELKRNTIERMKTESETTHTSTFKRLKTAAIIAAACCLIGIVVGPSVYTFAEYKVRKWNISLKFKDGSEIELATDVPCKKLPASAMIADGDGTSKSITTTLDKAEEMLKIDLLEHSDAVSDEVFFCWETNADESLACVYMYLPNWLELEGNGYIRISMSVLNEGADAEWVKHFQYGWDVSEKEFLEEYKSETLGSKVILYIGNGSEDLPTWKCASFIYEGVLYELECWQVTTEQIKTVIEEMQ